MKLLFIRHGDPDYTIDSLTEKGWKEAEFLSEKIAALDVRDFYVSRILHTEEKRKNSYRMQVAERIRRKDQKTGSSWGKDHSLGLASPGLDEDRKFLQL